MLDDRARMDFIEQMDVVLRPTGQQFMLDCDPPSWEARQCDFHGTTVYRAHNPRDAIDGLEMILRERNTGG